MEHNSRAADHSVSQPDLGVCTADLYQVECARYLVVSDLVVLWGRNRLEAQTSTIARALDNDCQDRSAHTVRPEWLLFNLHEEGSCGASGCLGRAAATVMVRCLCVALAKMR